MPISLTPGATNEPESEFDYSFNPFGQAVTRPSGSGTENFIYDGQNVALVLNSVGQVVERELYGPAVDQILATENVTPLSEGDTQSAGTVYWSLPDNTATVRDVAIYNATTNTTSVLDHLIYDPFGQVASQTSSGNQPQFTYQGMWQDPTTGLDYDAAAGTWYEPTTGSYLSPNASGAPADGGGGNPYSFNGNDPSGPGGAGGASPVFLLPPGDQADFQDDNPGNGGYGGGGGGGGFAGYSYPPVGSSSADIEPVGVMAVPATGSGGGAPPPKPVRQDTPPRPVVYQSPTWVAIETFVDVLVAEIQAIPGALANLIEGYFTGRLQTAMGERAAGAFRNENGRNVDPNSISDAATIVQFVLQDASGSNGVAEGYYAVDRATQASLTSEQALNRFVAGFNQLVGILAGLAAAAESSAARAAAAGTEGSGYAISTRAIPESPRPLPRGAEDVVAEWSEDVPVARTNSITGKITANPRVWDAATPGQRATIFWHEIGHRLRVFSRPVWVRQINKFLYNRFALARFVEEAAAQQFAMNSLVDGLSYACQTTSVGWAGFQGAALLSGSIAVGWWIKNELY